MAMFEAPVAHEAAHYSNPEASHYSNPEFEFEDELSHYSNPEASHYSNPYSNPELEGEEEISQILGLEVNTAKVRLHRARGRLKEKMEKYFAEEVRNL